MLPNVAARRAILVIKLHYYVFGLSAFALHEAKNPFLAGKKRRRRRRKKEEEKGGAGGKRSRGGGKRRGRTEEAHAPACACICACVSSALPPFSQQPLRDGCFSLRLRGCEVSKWGRGHGRRTLFWSKLPCQTAFLSQTPFSGYLRVLVAEAPAQGALRAPML
jgi:hypothetical protein